MLMITRIILLISPAFTLSLCIKAKSRLSLEARPAHLVIMIILFMIVGKFIEYGATYMGLQKVFVSGLRIELTRIMM